jgi:hypothetical protein
MARETREERALNGEHEYRVPFDVLTDKLAELLELGLNDMLACWNDAQRSELDPEEA